MSSSDRYDVLVVGGGLGGLSTALRLADAGVIVGLLLKRRFAESSSAWAQSGFQGSGAVASAELIAASSDAAPTRSPMRARCSAATRRARQTSAEESG